LGSIPNRIPCSDRRCWDRRSPTEWETSAVMSDLLMLLLGGGLFALMLAFALTCRRL
jgi:hypothetical protein